MNNGNTFAQKYQQLNNNAKKKFIYRLAIFFIDFVSILHLQKKNEL